MINKHSIKILILITASFFASQIQSSWGEVKVQKIKIPTQNGQWVVADLFMPESATPDNPAPAVIVIPGFQRSKETLSNIAIELSRRGIVTISIDPYAQGGSSSSMSKRAATTEGYGMFAIVDYIYNTSNINYIDKNRIAATGHSAGGLAAIRGAQYFGEIAKNTSTQSKLHSVFISGMVRMGFKNKDLKKMQSNAGMSYALYDEGAWQNKLKHGNMSVAPEALSLINNQLKNQPEIDTIVIGQYYGELSERTFTVVHNEKVIHPLQPYSTEAIYNQINFFLTVFGMNNSIPADKQVWQLKECFTFISLICSFLLIVPTAKSLLRLSYFRSLVYPVPEAIPEPKGNGKILFWSIILFTSIIACFSYIPLSELSKLIFVDASNRIQTWFFPQRMNNAIMLWAVLNGIIGLLLFFLSFHFFGKNNGILPEMWGLSISKKEFFKTIVLALLIVFVYFMTLYVIYYLFHVDYRFIFLGVRTFRPITLLLIPMYVPPFFIFFFSNSVRVNSIMRIKGNGEIKNMFFSAFVTTAGLIFILFIQYIELWITGTVHWKEGWLYVNLLFAVVPIMFVLPFFQRYFFNLTGKVFLGPITMSFIFIMILLSNTVCYFPL
tara:strand:- start:281 stop:2104 length:1824 start_codon:yes stop_codon:yes gene_type:complete